MKLLVNAVEFVVSKLHFGFPVTVHAPAHAQVRKLINLIHLLDFTVTGLTLLLSGIHVLRMVEINVVWQVMNPDPFNGFTLSAILLGIRIPSGELVQFLNLCSTIHL